MPVKLLYVVNDGAFFLSHRLPLAVAAKGAGYEVHVATADGPVVQAIERAGLRFHAVPIDRRGMNPITELRTLNALRSLYRAVLPDLVHHLTTKPVLYGGIAARLVGVPAVVNALTGLGYLFVGRSLKVVVVRPFVKVMYRVALQQRATKTIFQNPDDEEVFIAGKLIDAANTVVIRGSGVDMEAFVPSPEPQGTPVVVLAGRMIRHKGVADFVQAARILRENGVEARFVLVGDSDAGNPATISEAQLQAWQSEGAIEWWGRLDDMQRVFAQAHVVCLPSYYGEGVPKVLIEAAACARPLVATDTPGCREIARRDDNALLVPARNAEALAGALHRLIVDAPLRARMGQRSRQIAEAEFSLGMVIEQTLALYRGLLS